MIAGVLSTVRHRSRHASRDEFISRSEMATLVGLALCIVVASSAVCRAADIIINDVVIEGQVVAQPVFVQPALPDGVFDPWLYGAGRTAAGGRSRLETQLAIRVDDVERTCGLTPLQRKKLELAGRGDMQRFFERVEEVRRKFDQARHGFPRVENELPNNRGFAQINLNDVRQEIGRFQVEMNVGLFGQGSLYVKTLKKMLSPEQAEKHARAERERLAFAQEARLEMTIAALSDALGLRAEQRERLKALLAEAIPAAPQRSATTSPSHHHTQLILYHMSRISEDRLKPMFDPGQWRILSGQLAAARLHEPGLRQNGLLPDAGIDLIRIAPQGNAVFLLQDGRVFEAPRPAAGNRAVGEKRE